MDNFIVSARKYRPATFESVVGQRSITTTLKNAIRTKQIAQAFLFCGPRGVGKTTCARILAKTINCENLTESFEACNECPSCKSFNESTSFNVHELDAASNNSVEDIRSLVEQVRIPPQSARYKVYIIDEVHMLSSAAFNAFLKTLEEPPAYAKFILATTEKHKILPTILSRCQIYDFRRINLDDIADHLAYVANSEHISFEPEALHVIAQKADGGLRDALSMFDQLVNSTGHELTYKKVIENLNVLDFEFYFKITDALVKGDVSTAFLILNEVLENGFDGQHFLTGLSSHLRNILVCKDAATIKLLEVSQTLRNRFLEQCGLCSIMFIAQALDIANKCDLSYRTSSNKRLHIEIALLQMTRLNGQGNNQTLPGPSPQQQPTGGNNPAQPQQPTTQNRPVIPPQSQQPQSTIPSSSASTSNINIQQPAQSSPVTNNPQANRSGAIPQTTSIKINGGTSATTGLKNGNNMVIPSSGISIKPTASQAAPMPKEEPETEEEPEGEFNEPIIEFNQTSKSFTQTELERAWEKLQLKFDTLFSLSIRKPKLIEDFKIIYPISSQLEENEILQNRYDIVNFLKKELDNHQIELITELTQEGPVERKAFTDKDKFEKMAEKNPLLYKFREKLDLEIPY
ncbi:MAG: DNA polymerase III subunit gamma/tau [Bacteroidetes bacterium]|nr:DNA polymerase III subunit gamma/tau [Bacteroidota bacterium]